MKNSNNRYDKNTTCTKPPVLPQLLSYIVFLTKFILYFCVVFPNFENGSSRIIITVLYLVTLVLLLISATMSSLTDPSDTMMVQFRNGMRESYEKKKKQVQSDMLYCSFCKSFVNPKSKHCKVCDRCTQNFDHHCMWINNCIGSANYNAFFVMISFALLNPGVYLAGLIMLTIENTFSQFMAGFIVAWIIGLIVFVFIILLINLIVLHIYLICKGLSTFEFIMSQRAAKANQIEADGKKTSAEFNQRGSGDRIEMIEESRPSLKEGISTNSINRANANVVLVKENKSYSIEQEEKASKKPNQTLKIEERQVTDKSESISEHNKKMDEIAEQQFGVNYNEGSQSSLEVSQLFSRNKSLKIIVGKSQFYQPQRQHKNSRQPREKEKKSVSMFHPSKK